MKNGPIARRTLLGRAGLAIGGGFASGLAPPGAEVAVARAGAPTDLWSENYWAQKGDVKLTVYRKFQAPQPADGKSRPVLFLVHGSSLSALSSYDLDVPGGEYSMMNVFAHAGFDVWTTDHEGYGRSTHTAGNSDIASGVEDLKAAMAVVQRESGQSKVHMFGESSGAIRAGAFAQSEPDRVDRLILAAFTYKGDGAAEIERRKQRIAELRASPRRKRDAAMIRSIFTRDGHPSLYDPAMARRWSQAK